MQFKDTLRVLILSAVSSLIVFSCITVDKTIGLDNVPDEQQLAVKSTTFALPVGMRMTDSLQGLSDKYMLIGAFKTEEFGEAKFGCAANIAPQYSGINLGKDAKIISAYISLPLAAAAQEINTSLILDPSQEGIPQNINVYRLKVAVDTNTLYNNSLQANDYDPVPLNTSSVTYFGGDTLRCYLNNSFGAELLTATQEELDSLELFSNRFKGLYITCDSPATGNNSGRLNLFEYGKAYIYLKYNFQPTWESGLSRKDTTIRISFGYDYALNTSSYSSKALETAEAAESIYVEGIGGIAPYIDAQRLKNQLDAWCAEEGYDPKKIVVAKASMFFPFELPADLDMVPYTYPNYLFPTQKLAISDTLNTKYYYLFSDYASTGNTIGAMNRALLQYECDLSMTIQAFINKPANEINSDYNIWLYPLMPVQVQNYYGSNTTSYYINNYNYFKAKLNGPAAERHPQLKIVYTIAK